MKQYGSVDETGRLCSIMCFDGTPNDDRFVELPAYMSNHVMPTEDEALFLVEGKWVLKNIFDISKYKIQSKESVSKSYKHKIERLNEGIISNVLKCRIDCRESDIARVQAYIELLVAEGKAPTDEVDYICYDNTLQKVTLENLIKIKLEIINRINSLKAEKHAFYKLIDEATTKEEINSIPTMQEMRMEYHYYMP